MPAHERQPPPSRYCPLEQAAGIASSTARQAVCALLQLCTAAGAALASARPPAAPIAAALAGLPSARLASASQP